MSTTPTSDVPPPLSIPTKPKTHPSVWASLSCLVVYGVAVVAGLFLNGKLPGAGVVCSAFALPFILGATLCAIYGMCQGQIKSGLVLLLGASILLGVSCGSTVLSLIQTASAGSGGLEDQTEQLTEQLGELLKQFKE